MAVYTCNLYLFRNNRYMHSAARSSRLVATGFNWSRYDGYTDRLRGITRLTGSGLSITQWSDYGSLPPLNEQQWLTEFAKYKQTPQYSLNFDFLFQISNSFFSGSGSTVYGQEPSVWYSPSGSFGSSRKTI